MTRSIARLLFLAALAAALLAAPCAAVEVIVTTKSGQTYTGERVSDGPDAVVLLIAGIRTSIPRSEVEKVETKKTPEEEYAQRRAELADDDFPGRFDLVRGLYDADALTLCLHELQLLHNDFPDRDPAEVDRLTTIVRSRIKLQQDQQVAPARTPTTGPAASSAGSAAMTPAAGEVPLLGEDQINAIRLWELPDDLAAAAPRVAVPRQVIDELFEKYAADTRVPKGRDEQRRFRARQGWEQLQLLFSIQARDLYSRVIVRDDPAAIITFRRTIHPAYVIRYFRQQFEGKVEGLDLRLAVGDIAALPVVYTNFYLLSAAQYQGLALIDRDQPIDSLLIQWGLPREAASHPAPDVPGWHPFFRTADDPNVQLYVDWIASLFDRPQYAIVYPPPPSPAPAPAASSNPPGRGQ